jgi:DNA polymerase III alpha subunit
MPPAYIHLRLHSEYSIVDGIVRLEEAVAAAAADRMPALALTDLGNVFGMVKFYREARERGIKPIIGCDVSPARTARTVIAGVRKSTGPGSRRRAPQASSRFRRRITAMWARRC